MRPSSAVFSVGSASNYDISYVPTVYTIVGIPATVTAEDFEIVYGATTPDFTAEAVGLQGSDALDNVTYTFSGSGYGPSTIAPTNVGVYTISPSVTSLSPGAVANYSFTTVPGSFTITKRPVTVTPDSGQTKVYDGNAIVPSEVTYSITSGSLVGSDALSNVLAVSGTNAGDWAITKASQADSSNPNYDITVVTGVNYQITRQPVTVTATARTKVYGNNDPSLGYTTSPSVSLSGSLSRESGENVGQYHDHPGWRDQRSQRQLRHHLHRREPHDHSAGDHGHRRRPDHDLRYLAVADELGHRHLRLDEVRRDVHLRELHLQHDTAGERRGL